MERTSRINEEHGRFDPPSTTKRTRTPAMLPFLSKEPQQGITVFSS
jgi:hypothetical protein